MLKYLVILLDDSSVSYCHYNNRTERNLMTLETLRKGIIFAMKNDLKIQYVLPPYKIPKTYIELMNSMFHDNIGTLENEKLSDIMVINELNVLEGELDALSADKRYIVRTSISNFFDNYKALMNAFARAVSVNIVFTDIENFSDDKIEKYSKILEELGLFVKKLALDGIYVNTNLLTDRIALKEMNNCGAGDTSLSLAPDGNFYPCPAFYYEKEVYGEIGNLETGINIRNKKLFTLEGSPLCKRCDAFHCKRCVWLNRKLTYEINTPSRQQCIISHVERNASKKLLEEFHHLGLLPETEIPEIDYLDPFDKVDTWE